MAVYGDGGAAGLSATVFDSALGDGASASGAAVIAHDFTVSLSAIGTASPAALAGASAYTWRRGGSALTRIRGEGVAAEGFFSITQGGVYPVSFTPASGWGASAGAVCVREVEVIDDSPTEPPGGDPASPGSIAEKPATVATQVRTPVKKLYIKRGASITIPAAAYGAKDGKSVSARLAWSSSNSKRASVSKSGKVRALSPGRTTITVRAQGGGKASIAVIVVKKSKAPKKIALSGLPKSKVLKKGRVVWLRMKITPAAATITKLRFKSGKPSVLSVDRAGRLVAKKSGTATLTVWAGKKSQKIKIRVK
jgi:hypothetical protein